MASRRKALALCVAALLAFASHNHATTFGAELEALGHPNTHLCRVSLSELGLGQTPIVQFEPREGEQAELRKAISILELISEALIGAHTYYVGFSPRSSWTECRREGPSYLFWRDHENSWRLMRDKPLKYLKRLNARLEDQPDPSNERAYVLWSLASVQQWLGRQRASIANFQRAFDIASETDDPNGIIPLIVLPLYHHYVSEDRGEQQTQALLERFATAIQGTPDEDQYLPIVKYAPVYPPKALKRGIEGWVLLEFSVDASGRVQDPVILDESADRLFGEAAIEAAERFRYIPRVVDGKLVETKGVQNKITFELR